MTDKATRAPEALPAVGAQPEPGVRALCPERADFERHAAGLGYSVDPDTRPGRDGGYWSSHTHLMWETWQAARAWVPTRERKPKGGQMIVKRWRHGAVWAGAHNEGPKNESFDEWKAL